MTTRDETDGDAREVAPPGSDGPTQRDVGEVARPRPARAASITRRAALIGIASAATVAFFALRRRPARAVTSVLTLPASDPSAVRWTARRADAMSGSAFAASIRTLGGQAREAAVLREVAAGNVPEFMRHLVPVRLVRSRGSADAHGFAPPEEVIVWVAPDYFAVGSNDDFVRMPLMPTTAQRIADECGCLLPTCVLVDAIYQSAEVKLEPFALETGPDMVTSEAFLKHNEVIEQQRRATGGRLGALTAGHKKDIVITVQLATRPDRVAIYGMHRRDGTPIQSLSHLHEAIYVDYAHGVRFVSGTMLVGGKQVRVADVLTHPELAPLLSDEGPFTSPRYPESRL